MIIRIVVTIILIIIYGKRQLKVEFCLFFYVRAAAEQEMELLRLFLSQTDSLTKHNSK